MTDSPTVRAYDEALCTFKLIVAAQPPTATPADIVEAVKCHVRHLRAHHAQPQDQFWEGR